MMINLFSFTGHQTFSLAVDITAFTQGNMRTVIPEASLFIQINQQLKKLLLYVYIIRKVSILKLHPHTIILQQSLWIIHN